MISTALLSILSLSAIVPAVQAQVTATFPNGATNPSAPSFAAVGSNVNQTSLSRLLTLNGLDDFCLYGPPESGPNSLIGNVEPIVVAYCTKPRNNARIIPDGAIYSAKFIKTPLYVQISGFWDGTKVNIPSGDAGGELDPHGAENLGNPIGGNVTSNQSGRDVFYEEWMSFISYDQFCLRVCTAQTANVTTALQCEHELDIMGCNFVMALGPDFYQSNGTFVSCEGEAAAPPGLYITGGTTSTFRQRYTGTYTDGAGVPQQFTVGQTVTPSAPQFIPATSNCVTYATISNGINTANYAVTAAPAILSGGTTGTAAVSSVSRSTTISNSAASSTAASSSRITSAASGSQSVSGSNSAATAAATTSRASGAESLKDTIRVGAVLGGLAVAGLLL